MARKERDYSQGLFPEEFGTGPERRGQELIKRYGQLGFDQPEMGSFFVVAADVGHGEVPPQGLEVKAGKVSGRVFATINDLVGNSGKAPQRLIVDFGDKSPPLFNSQEGTDLIKAVGLLDKGQGRENRRMWLVGRNDNENLLKGLVRRLGLFEEERTKLDEERISFSGRPKKKGKKEPVDRSNHPSVRAAFHQYEAQGGQVMRLRAVSNLKNSRYFPGELTELQAGENVTLRLPCGCLANMDRRPPEIILHNDSCTLAEDEHKFPTAERNDKIYLIPKDGRDIETGKVHDCGGRIVFRYRLNKRVKAQGVWWRSYHREEACPHCGLLGEPEDFSTRENNIIFVDRGGKNGQS